jgi:uncharacterized protein (TIGR04255 family)
MTPTVATVNPLTSPPPKEVPLNKAPLVRVVAQVRFPVNLSIDQKDNVGLFQQAMRDEYPILRQEQASSLAITPQGMIQQPSSQIIWIFMDEAENWQIVLTPTALTLDTSRYSSRSDLIRRWEAILTAFNQFFSPQFTERFGLRYIDRLVGQDLTDVSLLLEPNVVGLLGGDFGSHVHQAMTETLFSLHPDYEHLLARWGKIAAGMTFDPAAILPIPEPSWILDLDMSRTERQNFNIESLVEEAQRFSERIYTFFRWAVTEEFLRRFGGAS